MSKEKETEKMSKEKLLRIIDCIVITSFFLIAPISVAAYFASGTLRGYLLLSVVYMVPMWAVLEIIAVIIRYIIKKEDDGKQGE